MIILITAGFREGYAQLKPEEEIALKYFQNRDIEKALIAFRALYQGNPSSFNYIYYMSCMLEQKELREAEKTVRGEIKKNPTDPRFQVDYGYILNSKGESSKGKKIYEATLQNLKADRIQIYNLANAYLSRRETAYALATYQRGRELFNDKNAFTLEIGIIYEVEGSFEQMINEYLNYCKSDPQQLPQVENRFQSWLYLDTDNSKHELMRSILLSRTQKSPDEQAYSELLLWYSVQEKDFELAFIQAKALDSRYKEAGARVFELALMAASNDDYEIAVKAFEYVINRTNNPEIRIRSRIELLNLEFLVATRNRLWQKSELQSLEKKYTETLHDLGLNPQTLALIRNLAHLQAFYLDKSDSAIALLQRAVDLSASFPRQQAECKLELADIDLFGGDQWEAILLYLQVDKAFKNDPLGHEAKFRYAKLSYYIGEFEWAKAQLDILKAATSKLIANDALALSLLISDNSDADSTYGALTIYARADFLDFRNKNEEALSVLDSIEIKYPHHSILDEVLYKKALICQKTGDWTKAAQYYSLVVEKYGQDILGDDALFQLALLNETRLNNKDKALELYKKLMTDYPGSIFVVEARKHFRILRKDDVS